MKDTPHSFPIFIHGFTRVSEIFILVNNANIKEQERRNAQLLRYSNTLTYSQ